METVSQTTNPTTDTATETKNAAVSAGDVKTTKPLVKAAVADQTKDDESAVGHLEGTYSKKRLIHTDSGQSKIIDDVVPYHQSDPEFKETGFKETTG